MLITSVRDLGADFLPWALNEKDDVVGFKDSLPLAILADGTVIPLPPEIKWFGGINNQGLILGRKFTGALNLLFDMTTSTMEELTIADFPHIDARRVNNSGDVVGTAGRGQAVTQDHRGFIFNAQSKAVTWVFPVFGSIPPGATPYLDLRDLNDMGHAVGIQGWGRGLEQLQIPIFYNGSTVTPIGKPRVISTGWRITNADQMQVVYFGFHTDTPGFEAIYDAPTNTLTPFSKGFIFDLGGLRWVLWGDLWANPGYYLDHGSGTTKLDHLFPLRFGLVRARTASDEQSGVDNRGRHSGRRKTWLYSDAPL
jgi:hypothetical protein